MTGDVFLHKIMCNVIEKYLKILANCADPLICSFTVTCNGDYLFTLTPADCPFTDFKLLERDAALNFDIDWNIFYKAKQAIINHYL